MNIAIAGDSHSGISKHDITGTNIFILQIPLLVNGEVQKGFDETTSLSKFAKILDSNATIESSSLTEDNIRHLWDNLLKIKQYDIVIHIPYSSMLGDNYDICKNLSEKYYKGQVYVVDNLRLGVSLKSSLFSAKNLAKKGYSPEEIVDWLEKSTNESSFYFYVDDPKYIKNNCKLNMTKTAFMSLNNSKPIFTLDNGIIDLKKRLINKKQAIKILVKLIEKDLKTKLKDCVEKKEVELFISYSSKIEDAIEIKNILCKKFPTLKVTFTDQMPICLVANLGLGAIMVGASKTFKVNF